MRIQNIILCLAIGGSAPLTIALAVSVLCWFLNLSNMIWQISKPGFVSRESLSQGLLLGGAVLLRRGNNLVPIVAERGDSDGKGGKDDNDKHDSDHGDDKHDYDDGDDCADGKKGNGGGKYKPSKEH
jgi:hypothetical protein